MISRHDIKPGIAPTTSRGRGHKNHSHNASLERKKEGYALPIVRDYLKAGGGNWLSANNTAVDATVTVRSIGLDEDTFDRAYVVVRGIYDPTGAECSIRLGRQNLKRISDTLGDDEEEWIGQKLKAIGFQDYPGLGSRGILWRGVSVPKQTGFG